MLNCEQTKGQSVLQHGQSVNEHVFDLISHLKSGSSLKFNWRLPEWLNTYQEQILANLHPDDVINEYTLYHDCGKPSCRTVDDEGRVHFPNHALVSKSVYLDIAGQSGQLVSNLIGWDMVIHTSSADEIAAFCENGWTIKDAFTLLLVSLSEVHSNAGMFGGIETNSFKSKQKKVERRGKQICKHYFTNT